MSSHDKTWPMLFGDHMPNARSAWRAYLTMVAVGSLALLPMLFVFRESATSVEVGAWQMVVAYAAVFLVGALFAHRAACALARGNGLLIGPLLGVVAFSVASATGCVVNALLGGVSQGRELWWDRCGEPFAMLLVVGSLPSLLVGGVFTVMMSPWLPRRPLSVRRPPPEI